MRQKVNKVECLKSKNIKGPQSVKTSKNVPKGSCLYKICFACASGFF